jgi:hypothetical protein
LFGERVRAKRTIVSLSFESLKILIATAIKNVTGRVYTTISGNTYRYASPRSANDTENREVRADIFIKNITDAKKNSVKNRDKNV